jgi:acetoin utilization deacetylase AcuC-like enzyme
MVAAAKHVLNRQRGTPMLNVAVSPTSGFHHACYRQAGGFCTFNGLLAAAVEVQRLGLAKKILILDFDNHYGNGTDDIIKRLGLTDITHITANKSYDTAAQALAQAGMVLSGESKAYDLILFQAGADINVDDPLGGILTTSEMRARDSLIFSGAAMRQTPIVWNLAGGYHKDDAGSLEPVLALHRQTMEICIKVRRPS